MKKKMIVSFVCLYALTSVAQTGGGDYRKENIFWAEDTTEVTTIDDIIRTQQEVTSRNSIVSHFEDVWSRQGYVNISFNSTSLSPDNTIETGVPSLNNGKVPEFKSNWGVSIQLGRDYRLHKKPISNILQFYIDYNYIDFSVNHFRAEGNGDRLYNSGKMFKEQADSKDSVFFLPWNLQKYEASFGMSLGPALTIAPFTYVKSKSLHYLHFNMYYRIGYHASILYMPNDKDADINQNSKSQGYEKMSDNVKLCWGHGMTHSFGFSASWKSIGIGYEHRSSKAKYKAVSSKDFGSQSYDFSSSNNRIFIQFRM